MSTTQAISAVEIGFALAALLMSVLAGLVLVPAFRKALRDDSAEGDRRGSDEPETPESR